MTTECHELTITDGVAELAYTGEKPWHRLGNAIPENASIEQVRRAAGMNWSILEAPVEYSIPTVEGFTGQTLWHNYKADNRKVLCRSDNHAMLSVVSSRYRPVQPGDVLEFFRDMVEAGGYHIESAGTMRGGARLFAVAKTHQAFALAGGDEVQGRLLLSTGCDGSMATSVSEVTIRVVCRNTLMAALNDRRGYVSVRHDQVFDAQRVQEQLRSVSTHFDAFREAAQAMTRAQVSQRQAREFIARVVMPDPAIPLDEHRGFARILALFDGEGMGADLPSSRGTVWGLLNAVTQYVDHEGRARSEDARQHSAMFGAGAQVKARAVESAMRLLA